MIPAIPRKFRFFPFLISLLITLAIGFVAALFTRPEITGWYNTLKKPFFNPPLWLSAPVWTMLYIIIAIAAYLVWKHRSRKPAFKITRAIYFVQLFLNFLWWVMFFVLHQLLGAMAVVIFLWISIILNINWFGKYSRVAGRLLWPYLLWISFVAVLNASIYLLNR